MVTASLLYSLPGLKCGAKMCSTGLRHLALNQTKASVQVPRPDCLWDTLPHSQPTFPPVPGKRAAAGMWFLIACWVRHTDNLGVKKGRKRSSYPVCLCSVVPCTDIRRSFCFTNMICICISEVVYVLFVYTNLLFQGINHYLLWQGVFAWKTGVWRIMWVQLQQLLFPETLNGLQNVTEEHNFIGMVTAEL